MMSSMSYKDSGINWIGNIPSHWNIDKIKNVAKVATGQTPPRELIDCFSDEKQNNYLWIKPEDLYFYKKTESTKEYITPKGLKYIKKYNSESIIFSGIGDIGKIGLSATEFTTNQQNHVIYDHKKSYKYMFYYLLAAKNALEQEATGNVVNILNASKLKNYYILVPPMEEQLEIANYLDKNIVKINDSINLLEKKVILFKKAKQALVFKIITKGLNPNTPIKLCEINGIGNIPIHWKVKKVKDIAKWQTGFTPDTKNMAYYNGNDDWITIRDMNGRYIKESKNKINGSLFPKKWITPANSLLFSFKLSIGQVAFNQKEVFTNEAICAFSNKSKINLQYFYYAAPIFINKNAKKNIYDADLLNQDLIANAHCLVPPMEEQLEIANYLDKECLKYDKKIELTLQKIDLLKKKRKSLIYNVITGKINIKKD